MDTSRICILARRHRACAQVTPANSGTCVASRTWYRSPPNGVNPCVGAVASSGHRSNVPQHPRPQCGAAALPCTATGLITYESTACVGIVPLVQLYGVQRGRHSEPAQITVSDIFVRTYGRPRASIEFCCCATAGISLCPPMQPRGSISKTQHHTTGNPGSIDVLVCGSAALEARPARCDCLEGHAEIPIRINIIL
jgi:hypothetical protein